MYVEQKQREARQQQENAALDASLSKEVGKARSVDQPEIIQAYSNYKGLKKRLLSDKQLQRNPIEFNKLQQQALLAYQNIIQTANKSSEIKDMQKQLTADRIKNPNAYSDDFGERMSTLMNTPVSIAGQHPAYGDLTNWDNYRYKGSNTNFAEIVQKGMGQPRQVYSKEEPMDKGLQTKITPYMYGNTPGQVRDYILGSMAMHQTGRDAAYQWDHTPEKEIEETVKAYQAIPKDYWEKIGLKEPQDLLPKNPDNKAENYASFLAMKYALANAPKEGTPVFRENKANVMAAQEAKERRMAALHQMNAKELIDYRKKIDPNDTELNNTWIESYLQKGIDNAQADPKNLMKVYTPHTTRYGHEIKGDVVLSKALTRGKSEPDKIYVTEDGKIWPIFYKYGPEKDDKGNVVQGGGSVILKNKNGDPIIDEDYSQPMTMDQAKLALGYKGQTKKQLEKTMKSGVKGNQTKHNDPLGIF